MSQGLWKAGRRPCSLLAQYYCGLRAERQTDPGASGLPDLLQPWPFFPLPVTSHRNIVPNKSLK